jgi:hypothetical protein
MGGAAMRADHLGTTFGVQSLQKRFPSPPPPSGAGTPCYPETTTMGENRQPVAKSPRCRVCGCTDVRRSMPHGFVDRLMSLVGLVPYRCRICGQRYFRPRSTH